MFKCPNCSFELDIVFDSVSYSQVSPGILPFHDKLPEKLDIGRRIRVKVDANNWFSNAGATGTIIKDYINSDDCSGSYGYRMYTVDNDDKEIEDSEKKWRKNNNFSIPAKYCEIID